MSLYFPTLPLDILGRASSGIEPLAILEHSGDRHYRILSCNPPAGACGVHPGMSLQASLVLAPKLICRHRRVKVELQTLQRLAAWSGRFSSRISLVVPAEILLEVSGSLSLYKGLDALLDRVQSGLAELGYQPRLAVAPYPQAASFLVRGAQQAVVVDRQDLLERLGSLPVGVLPPDVLPAQLSEALGIVTLKDLFRLPGAGLRKRVGPELPALLDRALGRCPDPRPDYQPESRFRSGLELPVPVAATEPLLFVARRLLQELAGVLEARGTGITRLQFALRHPDGKATRLGLTLVRPGRDPGHWLVLFRERLEQTLLEQEVTAITLRAGRQQPLAARNGDLFEHDERPRDADDDTGLLERLQARLGQAAVRGVMLVDDHRPERAWNSVDPGNTQHCDVSSRQRPLWLLPEPRSLDRARCLSWRLRGPERIETGWWDGDDVSRDYFLAETSAGERLWIFRDRRRQSWFLHGFFS